jgi:hypothetical protein
VVSEELEEEVVSLAVLSVVLAVLVESDADVIESVAVESVAVEPVADAVTEAPDAVPVAVPVAP